jgi:hypothetical protein
MNVYRTEKRETFGQDYAFQIPESTVLEKHECVRRIQQPNYLEVTGTLPISCATQSDELTGEAYIVRQDRSNGNTPNLERVDCFWSPKLSGSISNDF